MIECADISTNPFGGPHAQTSPPYLRAHHEGHFFNPGPNTSRCERCGAVVICAYTRPVLTCGVTLSSDCEYTRHCHCGGVVRHYEL